MTMLNISIVTYQPRQGDLAQLANTLAENLTVVSQDFAPITIWLLDNIDIAVGIAWLRAKLKALATPPHLLIVEGNQRRLGFGAWCASRFLTRTIGCAGSTCFHGCAPTTSSCGVSPVAWT